ncbi:proteasome component PRE2 [Purpureocillium lavendulum]|uniref:Proteasome component PRE2 n=1 Tax=Purpureocillium lavendulum TaxID=1247861 RepID=A0AB34G5X1_9HYPO|nr:proteasome component PRE2 [Purpureocillium lavendulum]
MTTGTWYALRSKAVHSRYGLSKNIQLLLSSFDMYKMGSIDGAELGRLVRLSPQRRAALANTISKCAGIIKKQPSEVKTCVEIIEMCTEVLEIAGLFPSFSARTRSLRPEPFVGLLTSGADRRPPDGVFPFRKLPMEIRDKILDLIITNVFRTTLIVPAEKRSCECPSVDRGSFFIQTKQMKALPTLLGASLNHEFCRIFFRKHTFRFRCCCELLSHLERNNMFVANVRHLVVHWCGDDSAKAFQMLAKCPRLETLNVSISKSTYTFVSARVQRMRVFFPASFRNIRPSDLLGLDELLDVRGLKDIQVSHASNRANAPMSIEMDRSGLSRLLSASLLLPRDVSASPQRSVPYEQR